MNKLSILFRVKPLVYKTKILLPSDPVAIWII